MSACFIPYAQHNVIDRVLQETGIDPRAISYIEAHGTGTSLGDPIEIRGLTTAFRQYTQENQFCAIGSAKSNIGHCESAAGIAGVTKVLLQLKYRQLAPSLHSHALNPNIDFRATPFFVQQELSEWARPKLEINGTVKEYPRIAGISSFGAGGSNAHVIIEEYIPPPTPHTHHTTQSPAIVVLSAKNDARLREQAQRLSKAVAEEQFSEADLADMAYTLQVGREPMEERLAVIVLSLKELEAKLQAFAEGADDVEKLYRGQVKGHKETLNLFAADEDMEKTIATWIHKGKYARLSELWVKGMVFDWNTFYGKTKPHRISLPAYPFARERYWIDDVRLTPVLSEVEGIDDCQSKIENRKSKSQKPGKISLPSLSQQPLMPELSTAQAQAQIRLDALESEPCDPATDSGQRRRGSSSVTDAQAAISAEKLQQELTKSLSETLYMKQDEIDPDEQFIDLGMDSIIGVEWIRALNQQYGMSMSATTIYDHPNIHQLAGFLAKELHQHRNVHPEYTQKDISIERQNAPTQSLPPHSAELSQSNNTNLFDDADSSSNVPRTSLSIAGSRTTNIAVIGMSGQFPKSKTLAEFWDNLAHGRDCISEIPATRWSMAQYYDPDPHVPGKTYSKWMGVLEDVDRFDPLFFNISPAEAEVMDPQQRLFLEHCWSCLEDAGLSASSLSGTACGVFVGCGSSDYGQSIGQQGLNAQGLMGGSSSILSARISYFLNLKGPCLAIDTACSSSLVAIAQACDSLLFQRSNLAFAGGVCVLTGPAMHIMTANAGMLSKDGRCFTFDDRANGFVPGEGVGVVLLKRLSDAIRDHDHIYGVIRGWGINQDGKTNGITAPSVNSQIALEKEVYQRFAIHPDTISLVEAHGTGTKLGDPIEVEALIASFRAFTNKQHYCALGSVKSNIGHVLTAAGAAGIMKVLLSLQHRMLPPTIHFDTLNEHITLDGSPFYVNTQLQDWETEPGIPRRTAVSSFGFSGTNAHIVIEEYIPHSENNQQSTINNQQECR